MDIVFFEDDRYKDLAPISLSHPAFMLLCGSSRIFAKWVMALEARRFSFQCRDYLAPLVALETGHKANVISGSPAVFINGRFLPSKDSIAAIRRLQPGESLLSDDALFAFRPPATIASRLRESLLNLHSTDGIENAKTFFRERQFKAGAVNYLWDLVAGNGELIESEFVSRRRTSKTPGKIDPRAAIINKRRVTVAAGAKIGPQAVIDATEGPVIVDNDAVVEPLSYIKGPVYIGAKCKITSGRIREGCSFGPVCRVGGEVEQTIMLGYCNKYHDGFLGHSYLGEWVNLGAMTTNSDLKNNYSVIKAGIGERMVDTGQIKVGCFIGDHTKTGIGTLLNTGISVGFSCNLYGGGLFDRKTIKSFSWGTSGELVEYKLEKALSTASISMQRRGIELTPYHSRLFEEIRRLEDRS